MAEKVVFVTGMFFLLFLVISKANAPTGFAEICSVPDGARVVIDDVPRGFTKLCGKGSLEISLSPGKHTIVITKDGHTGYLDAFRIDRGETKEIKVELEKIS